MNNDVHLGAYGVGYTPFRGHVLSDHSYTG